MLSHIRGQILLTRINNNCRKLICLLWLLSMKQTFDWHMSMFLTSCANQVLHSLASRGFQNPGVCLQAFSSFPRSRCFIFCLLLHNVRSKTKNPFPLSFFSLKSNGHACYSGYAGTDTKTLRCWLKSEVKRNKYIVQDRLWGASILVILQTKRKLHGVNFWKDFCSLNASSWGALDEGQEKEGELATMSLEFELHL